jgi:hypothetical protein
VLIDFTHGKGKYRKHGPRYQRPIVRERVIIRPSAPRLYVVDKRK